MARFVHCMAHRAQVMSDNGQEHRYRPTERPHPALDDECLKSARRMAAHRS
ncbi:hypothetical protein FEP05_01590 [Burkholderia multivorans]|nr:hypothetical protein [Burkholderia multivorans]MDR9289667.1 hypothetical protein [Burkholderia multivorans]MDR9323084.1 hypothetical protein [Burkholderia multivorans]